MSFLKCSDYYRELCHSERSEHGERSRRIYVGNIIKCSVSVATMLINIIIIVRGDNSHSVAIRMHSERSVGVAEEFIKKQKF